MRNVSRQLRVTWSAHVPARSPRQAMRLPVRQRPEFLDGLHVLQEGQHAAQLADCVRRQAAGLVAQIQAPQASMGKRPNLQLQDDCNL